jgi:hypothetical protein
MSENFPLIMQLAERASQHTREWQKVLNPSEKLETYHKRRKPNWITNAVKIGQSSFLIFRITCLGDTASNAVEEARGLAEALTIATSVSDSIALSFTFVYTIDGLERKRRPTRWIGVATAGDRGSYAIVGTCVRPKLSAINQLNRLLAAYSLGLTNHWNE